MSDANEKKKKPTRLLRWFLVLIALAGIVLIFWPYEKSHIKLRKNKNLQNQASAAVNLYLQWTEDDSLKTMSNNDVTLSEGLNKIADALGAIEKRIPGISNGGFDAELQVIRSQATLIANSSDSNKHAEMLKKAFLASAQVLEELQVLSFPKLEDEVAVLNQKILDFEADAPLSNQKNKLKEIFKQTGVLLKGMDVNEESE